MKDLEVMSEDWVGGYAELCGGRLIGEKEPEWSGKHFLYLFRRALCSFAIASRGMARLGIGMAFRIIDSRGNRVHHGQLSVLRKCHPKFRHNKRQQKNDSHAILDYKRTYKNCQSDAPVGNPRRGGIAFSSSFVLE